MNETYGFVGENALVAPQANAMAAVIQPLMMGGVTPWLLYGIGAGLITALIRFWGVYPEGVSFAILLMNILNPYIDMLTARKVFGGSKK